MGDEAFRIKSLDRMNSMIAEGTSVVLVSHALDTIRDKCDRVMWLDHGRVVMVGDPDDVVAAYRQSVSSTP